MDDDLPDLVRDYKLKTWYDGAITIHEYNDPNAPPLSPPRQERWRKVRSIGHGGQGEIVLETCIDGSRNFTERAVKKIRFHDNDTKRRYQRELATMIKFSHDKYSKYFVKSLGWFVSSSKLYIAMEYFPAGDLYSYVQKYQYLPENDGRQIASQLLSGLSLMHSEGFSHRDIKPQNILIYRYPKGIPSGAWWVKLADFGISKRLDKDTNLTIISIGTAAYMAPELCRPDYASCPTNDYRAADIWALGITIFFVLTNTVPFQDMMSTMTYAKNHGESFPHAPLDGYQISQDGQAFIRQAITPRPEARLKLDEAMSHVWIESLLPSIQAPGVDSRPSTISSRRSSFNNGKGHTTELSTLATRSTSEDFRVARESEHQISQPGNEDAITIKSETKDGHLGPEDRSHKTDPPVPDQANDASNQFAASANDRGAKVVGVVSYEHGSNSMSLPFPEDHEAELTRLLEKVPEQFVLGDKAHTPIIWASIKGEVALTNMLILAGADPEELDDQRMTPLYHAVRNGHFSVAMLLLDKGANVNGGMSEYSTPLRCAAWLGDEAIVKLLLDRGANVEVKDGNGSTPLILAVKYGHESVVNVLLDHGAKVEAKDNAGQTSLIIAVDFCYEKIVKILLDNGANIEAEDSQGMTALILATSMGLKDIRETLLQRGAKKSRGYYGARLLGGAKHVW